MSATEKIRELLREGPRTVSELARLVYGTAYGTPRSQVHNRLKNMVAKGEVRAERTGEASNALVIYHWVGHPGSAATTPPRLLEELETQLRTLTQTVTRLRQALEAG